MHIPVLIEGLVQSLCGPECELELELLRRLIHNDLVDPLGMFLGPFPRSPSPLAVLQVVESAGSTGQSSGRSCGL